MTLHRKPHTTKKPSEQVAASNNNNKYIDNESTIHDALAKILDKIKNGETKN